MDAYVGEIRTFTGNFAPRGWQLCNGGLFAIRQYTAVFSILGNLYGGDGKVTFAVPNLGGMTPIHPGSGPGLTLWDLGDTNGVATNTLMPNNIPRHNHVLNANSAAGDTEDPSGNVFCARGKNDFDITTTAPSGTMNPASVSPSGTNLPYNNMQPYLTLNYIICFDGIFPMRPS